MELTAGYPFWLLKVGLPFTYPKLLDHAQTKVAILGGGISGALTAYSLCEAGMDCILLDGRTIGLGSTCASTSLLQYELDQPLHLLMEQVGEYNAIRAYQLCGEAIDLLKNIMDRIGYTNYELRKSLFFTSHTGQLDFMKKELSARKKAGFELTLLSEQELKNDFGMRGKFALLSEKGATINAYKLTHALLQYCIGKGLRVYDRSKVKNIRYTHEGVELETGEGYIVHCSKLVNATGFEIVNFISKDIVDLYCTYAVVSENDEEKTAYWRDRVMIWNTDDPYLYMRLTDDNRIMIGGRDERFSTKASRHIFNNKSEKLIRDFKKIFPQIPFKSEFSWSGSFGKTKDSLPYIGEYAKTPNTLYALGFGGNGITFSVIASQMITDFIQGRHNPDAAIFSFDRKNK